ncbi:hypothetical protein SAMN05444166_0032 [Singulisphaera sp. GP187]|uniref:hypothetical protein n=1 Tax=Singulisphaera sp. GP187 TaxID=1882752 RepID=UPI00092B4BD4|nr:hypothetical protein [Singulisphaera sp. GP187]SIN67885.1 hypothetical protein SAMN05444166_0032 [Singulisphaera sp. GP187]
MKRFVWRDGIAVKVTALMTVLALVGCGEGAPSVSSSTTEVAVHGTVKYKGQPVKDGSIRFDPANIQRKDAKAVSAPIGPDGTYTIKTLQGENTISFTLPELSKKDFSVASASFVYNAPVGESTYDVELAK